MSIINIKNTDLDLTLHVWVTILFYLALQFCTQNGYGLITSKNIINSNKNKTINCD